jgi:outer membrane receptor protein involved in Fe transport
MDTESFVRREIPLSQGVSARSAPTSGKARWRRFCHLAVWLLLGTLVFVHPARAGDSSEFEGDEYLLFDETEQVTTATKKPQRISESPATVTVITREDILNMGVRSLPELLKYVVGATIHRTSITPRSIVFFESMKVRTLLLIDGRPAFDVYLGSFYGGYQYPLDIVKRIEIIRSPGSALYGTNALGGIINIVTLSGEEDQGVFQSATVGSHGRLDAGIHLGRSTKNYGGFLSVHASTFEGDHSINKNDDIKRFSIFEKFELQPLNLTISMGYLNLEQGLPGVKDWWPTPHDRVDVQQGYLDLLWSASPAPRLNLMARAYLNLKRTLREAYFEAGTGDSGGQGQGSGLQEIEFPYGERRVGGELKLTHEWTRGDVSIIGLEGWGTLTRDEHRRRSYQSESAAMYLHHERRLGRSLKLNISSRYDYDDRFKHHLSHSVALLRPISDIAYIKLGYGRGLRIPTDFELYIDQDLGPVQLRGNPDLREEVADTIELGYFQRLLAYHQVTTFNLYYSRIRDYVSLHGVPNQGYYQPTNYPRARQWGAELELSRSFGLPERPPGQVIAFLNFTYQVAEEDASGLVLPYSPRTRANAGVTYRPNQDLRVSLLGHWVDAQETRLEQDQWSHTIASYLTLDLTARYDLGARWTFTAGVYNAFDKQYEERRSEPALGRTFGLGMRVAL